MKKKWVVYIIQASDGRLYTGITVDMERRFKEHSEGRGAKFFRTTEPVKIVYQEKYLNRSQASIREAEIKKLRRSEKEKLFRKVKK